MEHFTNRLLRDFFLGDSDAWEEVCDLWTNRMQGWLNYHFKNLPDSDRYELISIFQVKFLTAVKAAREEAEREIRNSPHPLSIIEIEATKIKWCRIKTGFDLSFGSHFEDWMWKCLFHEALSALKRRKLSPGNTIELDKEDEAFVPYEQFSELQTPAEPGGLQDVNVIEDLLKAVMERNELLYLNLWFNSIKEGPETMPDPDASQVIAAVKEATGKTLNNSAVTQLKQSFLAKAYLAIIEHSMSVNSLAGLFRRLSEISGNHHLMAEIMMQNIWLAFYEDENALRKSRTELSKELWVTWEALTLKKAVQEKILVEAYQYFRLLRPPHGFCRRIELYADNRFGSKIRQIFMRGGR